LPARGAADPLDAVNIVLRCENIATINASINPELNRC